MVNQKSREGRKVFVALSGGVDSSVTAALLKERGYNVTGVFIKVWQPEFLKCTWPEERLDAMRVCAQLKIPFKTYDFEAEYKRDVVDYMVSEYRAGRTPNPDVMCNIHIKFDVFLKKAFTEGAECIATGHYVQSERHNSNYELYTAADQKKDQSYFLWSLGQYELESSLFPIGSYQKNKVRALAEKYRLPTAHKRDSQGLCFLGKLDMHNFLTHFITEKPGDVLSERGTAIGNHSGTLFYTLGQRHGFEITAKTGIPHYVIAKDMEKNTITVSTDQMCANFTTDNAVVRLSQINWIHSHIPTTETEFVARSRYRQMLCPCILKYVREDTAMVSFPKQKPLMPPGQSLVLYEKTAHNQKRKLVGGGIIEA